MTAALSSNESLVPSGLRKARACLTTTAGNTCFLRSGLPLETETIIMSPTQAAGTRRRRPWYPRTLISFNSFAPVLSAHVSREPTGRPRAILGLYSTIPRALTALVFGAGMSTLLLVSYLSLQMKLLCSEVGIPRWSLDRPLLRRCRVDCGRGSCFSSFRICCISDNSASKLAQLTRSSAILTWILSLQRPFLSMRGFRGMGRSDRCTQSWGP